MQELRAGKQLHTLQCGGVVSVGGCFVGREVKLFGTTEYVFFQIKVSFISLFDNFKQCAMKHKGGKQQKWLEDVKKPCPEGNQYRRCIGTRTDVCVFWTCKFLIFFA